MTATIEVRAGAGRDPSISPDDARAIAKDAYIYGFPLVDDYRILHSYFVDRGGPEYKAPWNRIHNETRVYTPSDTAIQTPNSDTPYSQLGADLRTEPLVITVPRVREKRYFSLQFIDLYTYNFAYVGSRATGNDGGSFLLVGPGWSGETPPGITSVIRADTELAFVLYRTQLFGADDIENVERFQNGYKVQPLSEFLGTTAPARAPAIDFPRPLSAADQRTSVEFFELLNFVLHFCPTLPSEIALMERFAALGIGPGATFDAASLSPALRTAIEAGMADAWAALDEHKRLCIDTGKESSADLFGTREFLNNNYLHRMTGAALGIYGNSKEEAIYPAYFVDAKGEKLDGATRRYTIRFAPGQLPPVNAFWSITMYRLPESLLVANPLERYLINSSMLPGLVSDADGGLTLYFQPDSPGPAREPNWLPAPKGPFLLAMRLYWPKPEALDGRWKSPQVERATDVAVAVEREVGASRRVTPDNFRRAETDTYFAALLKRGRLGRFDHLPNVVAIDDQTVIRSNRDTVYSSAVFDLGAGPVTILLPDAGTRFLSMMILDEDHYVHAVVYGAGRHTFSREQIPTRYFVAVLRIMVDPKDETDLKQVHALQQAVRLAQPGGPGRFETPSWDKASQDKVRAALLALGETTPDMKCTFGARDEVDPVRHLIGTAMAWGGNPEKDATYLSVVPPRNDGVTVHRLRVKDVPVDGFWSVSVYNEKGFFQKNDRDSYTVNSTTAVRDADGSVRIQFGGCDDEIPNCLPITKGWNYTVRLYRPRAEILNGTWKFAEAQPESDHRATPKLARASDDHSPG